MEAAWVALALTLKVALWATALNLLLGVGIGYAMARWRFAGREVLDAVFTLPMVMPPTVLGYYLLVLIGSQGPIGAWLLQHFGIRLIFTWQGAVIAAMVVSFPLVFKGARAAFETVDAAARGRGAHVGHSRDRGVLSGLAAAGVARHPGRPAAVVRACARRVRRHADGGRQHSRAARRRCRSRSTRRCRRARTTSPTSWSC